MSDLFANVGTSFVLGVLTPTTAACVIPLYPAFLARLSRQVAHDPADRRLLAWYGLIVTAGVIAFMVTLGLVFTTLLQESLTAVIGVVSPLAFGVLLVLGLFLVFNIRLTRWVKFKPRGPRLQNPWLSAFLYGFFFGAIVVPCNPLFIAAFFARTVSSTRFAANMLNFLAFGAGIGAPLLAFSLISRAASRTVMTALTTYHRAIDLAAGLVMVSVSAYYLVFVFRVFG